MALNLEKTKQSLIDAFGGSCDINVITFHTAGRDAATLFVDGMIDTLLFEDNILKPLKALESLPEDGYFAAVNDATMMTTPLQCAQEETEAIPLLAAGDILLLIDGAEGIFIYSERKYAKRAVMEPPVSSVLRGPREGFVEDMKTNMNLIRRRIATEHLRLELLSVGRYTATKLCVAYVDGIAEPSIVEQLKERLREIDIDGIIESSYVARYLEDNPLSLFSQVGASEKPDILTAKMLEGRVAIIVDGSPMVLSVPFVLYEHFQASEDYYMKSYRATLIRTIRLIAVFIGVLLPALYVSLQEFQYRMLPLKFLLSLSADIYDIPLSPTLEMLTILVIFEILNEASVRMPRYVGMALSIVGAIVLGETAVNAGLFSTPAILVVAVSSIGLFCVPEEVNSGSVLRIAFAALAGVLGVYGIVLCAAALIAYLASLKSFGTAYLAPFAPSLPHDWQDGILKSDLNGMIERPYTIPTHNRVRQRIKRHK